MSERERLNIWAVLGAMVTAGIGALAVAVSSGAAPIPPEYEWLRGVAVAVLLAAVGGGAAATHQFKPGQDYVIPLSGGRES